MYENIYNERPKYTSNEIVSLFKKKFYESNDNISSVAERYKVNEETINHMMNKKCQYSYKMLKIASDYLDITYDELTDILVDDEKVNLRSNTHENMRDSEELFNLINYMFNEMIKHKRMSCD